MELSGGMKTRVCISARAIFVLFFFKHLYLDEPFISLDISRRWVMYRIVRMMRLNSNYTTILTTHDLVGGNLFSSKLIVVFGQ